MITDELIARFAGKPEPSADIFTDAVEVGLQIQIHTLQVKPTALLTLERPNESGKVKLYREKIYRCPTHSAASKILENIGKIPRAQGYKMHLPDLARPVIREGKDLDSYLTKDFPEWDSFENYVWGYLAEQMVNDPNGIVAVYPRHIETGQELVDGMDYAEPFPYYYNSADVLEYAEGEHVVIKRSDVKSWVTVGDKEEEVGNVLLMIDRYRLIILEQYGKQSENKYREKVNLLHDFKLLPAFQLGSKRILESTKTYKKYASFLSPCIPDWEKAIFRDSDEQACLIDHVAPEKYRYATAPCNSCGPNTEIDVSACKVCHGTSKVISYSPYGDTVIYPLQDEVNGPMHMPNGAPAAYVQKDIEGVKFISEKVTFYVTKGLDAVGLAILDYVPLAQSGIAKQQDKSEAETFFYNVGSHIKAQIMLPSIYFIQEWRYPMLKPEARTEYYNLIRIEIPTVFSLLHPAWHRARAKEAKENGEHPSIQLQTQIDQAQIEFGIGSETYNMVRAMAELDPYPGLTAEEKLNLLMGVTDPATQRKIRISIDLYDLIQDAVDNTDGGFFEMSRKDKKAMIYGMVPMAANPFLPAPEPTLNVV